MKLGQTIADLIRGHRESLHEKKARLAVLMQDREAAIRAPATVASIKAAFLRDIDATADQVPEFAKHHFARHHKASGGNWFDSVQGLSLLGIPTSAPAGGAPAPTIQGTNGQTHAAILTYVFRKELKAAASTFVDDVYTDEPGAISTAERTKRLAAIDGEAAKLESEISDIENAFVEARRVAS
jgi:hypothetical protein